MKILIACEFSGIVREAFAKKGHDVWSCDLEETEIEPVRTAHHMVGDVRHVLHFDWDLMIAHPPCTDLAASGARWWKEKQADGRQQASIDFFLELANADIPKIAIENPIGIMPRFFRKPDQYIEPYEYGHPETKKTCLWLKGLPKLKPTNIVEPTNVTGKNGKVYSRIHFMSGNKAERSKLRSLTYQGWADAMAEQWG